MSIVMTSGLSDSASATASRPSLALPTTWSCSSALKIPSRTLRINRESSTTSTRIFLLGVAIVCLPHRRDGARRLRSYELFDRRDQLILLDRLGQECRGAFLHRPITMLCPRARRNDHYGNSPRRGALAQLHHQFVAGHARHFEIGYDQMAAVLRHQFGGLESIRRQFHPVSVLLQHSADEFAHADGIVGHHDHALLLDAVDGLGRNASARNGHRARRKDSRGAGACLYRPMPSISSARRRRISSTTANGSAKLVVPQRTNRAGEIIRVRGTLSVNFVPLPLVLWISISPFSVFRFARTTSSPTPRPASSVLTGAVENPGWKSISRRSRSVSRSAVSSERSPRSIALCFTRW